MEILTRMYDENNRISSIYSSTNIENLLKQLNETSIYNINYAFEKVFN
jgi:hypothetical protein